MAEDGGVAHVCARVSRRQGAAGCGVRACVRCTDLSVVGSEQLRGYLSWMTVPSLSCRIPFSAV